MKKIVIIILSLVLFIGISYKVYIFMNKDNNKGATGGSGINTPVNVDNDYNIKLLKQVNSMYKTNYLISPYSIEIALNMLKEGANNNTYKEINNLVGNRTIKDISNKDIGIANALFIKNEYKNSINKDFTNTLVTKYNSEVLYDEFKTPKVINDWANKKTNKMIPYVLADNEDMSSFVLGLANAIAIDVKWLSSFECINTKNEEFNNNGNKLNVEMMYNTYRYQSEYKYFETDDAKGVILPYQEDNNIGLEFVGILPNNDVNSYINNLTEKELNNIDKNITSASDEVEINLSLPRFSYNFDLDNFKEILQELGVKDAFNQDTADFTKMISKGGLYVGVAVHKTKIELNELGTKAAAVTYFGMDKNSLIEPAKRVIDVKFNKPFIYLIREKNTKELLFAGVVYEPNNWQGSTCSE